MTVTITLVFNTNANAFHENLGIDDNKASELYNSKPNDPAIVQWKNSLQSTIDTIPRYDYCFVNPNSKDCGIFFSSIIDNCKSHPNTLIGCNDSRLKQYVLALNKTGSIPPPKINEYAKSVIDKCIISNSTFAVASDLCNDELLSLGNECGANFSSYEYCKDSRFVGYLSQYNILNTNRP